MTDSNGNSASVSACGFTLTGEDAQQDNAEAGDVFLNLVVEARDNESDRGVGVASMFNGAFVAPVGASCGDVYMIGQNDCYPIGPGTIGVWASFYDLTSSEEFVQTVIHRYSLAGPNSSS